MVARRGSIAAAGHAVVPVTFDAVSSATTPTVSFNPSLAITQTHTCSGVARAVVVAISSINNSMAATSETRVATYDGVTMTSLGMVPSAGGATDFVELFGLLNPPTGAKTWVVTVSGGGNTGRALIGDAQSYNGVASFGTFFSNTGPATAMSITATSAVNHMVAQAFETQSTTSAYNQTSRASGAASGHVMQILAGDAPGAASVSFTATVTASNWAAGAVDLVPA